MPTLTSSCGQEVGLKGLMPCRVAARKSIFTYSERDIACCRPGCSRLCSHARGPTCVERRCRPSEPLSAPPEMPGCPANIPLISAALVLARQAAVPAPGYDVHCAWYSNLSRPQMLTSRRAHAMTCSGKRTSQHTLKI